MGLIRLSRPGGGLLFLLCYFTLCMFYYLKQLGGEFGKVVFL